MGNKARPVGWTLRESYIVIIKIYIKERRPNILRTKILHMLRKLLQKVEAT